MTIGDAVIYLAELTVYDVSLPGTRVLRYSTGNGFVTGPAETPASTFYDPRLKQPALMKRDAFSSGTTSGRSRVGFGDLILINDDGQLDGLLEYGFDGRAITIRRGLSGAAYPSGFTTVLVGTMEQPEFTSQQVTVKLRDRQFSLGVPLQPTKYAGSNALPAGLEGVSDLKGKPKPVCYGAAMNVPAVLVNSAKLIFQVAAVASGAACNSVDLVYDKGIPLTTSFPLTQRVGLGGAGYGFSKRAAAYGNGLYLLGGEPTGSDASLVTSPDGVTWTARTPGFSSVTYINALAYGNGVYVAAGQDGANAVLRTSSNGTTGWTSRTHGFGTNLITAVIYAGSQFVAVGGGGDLATSPDGITWTHRTSSFGATTIRALAYGNGQYIAVGSSSKLATSPDGITWTQQTSGFGGTDAIYSAVWAESMGVFVIGGENARLSTSPDGITWTSRSGGFSSTNTITTLVFGNGLVVAGAQTLQIATSFDAFTWSLRSPGTFFAGQLSAIGFGNGLFFMGDSIGIVGCSTPPANYASLADLSDDTLAPPAGTFKAYPTGGYFRLGSSPAGLVTADVTQGAAAADRTAGQIFGLLLTRAGLASGTDYSTADITALDTANSSVLGFWTDQETTFGDVLDLVAASVGAWWGPDKDGVFRIKQLTLPTGTANLSITANDLLKPLERISTQDEGRGLPSYRTIIRYLKNYAVQTTDLAAGVSDARRGIVGQQWRETSYTDSSVQTAHLLAPETVEETLLTVEADSLAEATRRQTMRGSRRDRFVALLQLNSETELLDMGGILEITHSRYGLSGAKKFRILGLEPNAAERTLTLSVWG